MNIYKLISSWFVFMVRSFDGETVLKGLLFDIDRMIRDKCDPEDVLLVLRKKERFLSRKSSAYKIKWW